MDEKWIEPTNTTRCDDNPMESNAAKQSAVYTEIGQADVLLGRGKKFYSHGGNVRFRKLVLDRALAYKQKNKAHRRALAQDIINNVRRSRGKFLRPIDSGDTPSRWRDVPTSITFRKVKQALRDMSSRIPAERHRKRLAAIEQGTGGPASHHHYLASTPNTVNPPRVELPTAHPQQIAPFGPLHPLLLPQSFGQEPEYSLPVLVQLAALIQERNQTERMRQELMTGRRHHQTVSVPPLFQQQPQTLLQNRLNTPMSNQQELLSSTRLWAQQEQRRRDLIQLRGLLSSSLDHSGGLAPSPQGTTTTMQQLLLAVDSMQKQQQQPQVLPGLHPPQPQRLGTAPASTRTARSVSLETATANSPGIPPPQGTDKYNSKVGLSPRVPPITTELNAPGLQDDLYQLLDDAGEEPPTVQHYEHDAFFGDLFDDDEDHTRRNNNRSPFGGADDLVHSV